MMIMISQSPLEKRCYGSTVWVQDKNVKSNLEKKSSNEQGNADYGPRPTKVAG